MPSPPLVVEVSLEPPAVLLLELAALPGILSPPLALAEGSPLVVGDVVGAEVASIATFPSSLDVGSWEPHDHCDPAATTRQEY